MGPQTNKKLDFDIERLIRIFILTKKKRIWISIQKIKMINFMMI